MRATVAEAGRGAVRPVLALLLMVAVPAGAFDPWPLWAPPTRLRGANLYQRRVHPALDGTEFLGPGPVGPPVTRADMDRLARLGANLVVLSHPGVFTVEPPYGPDQEVVANLDRLLEMAAQAGLFVVIAFRSGPGRSTFSICCREETWLPPEYLVETVWSDPLAQDGWVAMWRYAASRYAGHPALVGYDPMVEPNANDVVGEWDPEVFHDRYGGTLADWNRLHPRITAAIREVDPVTPVLLEPQGYGGVDWLPYLAVTADPRIVYTVHQYAPHVYTHQDPATPIPYPGTFDADYDGEPEAVDRDWLHHLLGTVDAFVAAHGVRSAVTETGVVRWAPGAERFLADEIGLFEARGLAWAVWSWDPAYAPWTSQVNAFNFRFGSDPASTEDVPGNPLEAAIASAWARNHLRPARVRRPAGRVFRSPSPGAARTCR